LIFLEITTPANIRLLCRWACLAPWGWVRI